ncbi:hypothetical protein Tco_0298712 [Tanacetum coccineum]
MVVDELVLHMLVVVEETCRTVKQLVKAVVDIVMECTEVDNWSHPHGWYGTYAPSKFSPDTELVLYPLQDKLTLGDKSLDLSAFKLSRLFFSLLSLGSSSCWRLYRDK